VINPRERAIIARSEIEHSILDYLQGKPEGATNVEVARDLGLESGSSGGQKNYLSYSLLGGLVERGLIKRENSAGRKRYKLG
jgi:DNA-binding IclR family transcriptional regulator